MKTQVEQPIKMIRTEKTDNRFIRLVSLLDAELAERDGEDHGFYSQFNSVNEIQYAVLAIEGQEPIGSGGLKMMNENCIEIKRMYVKASRRGSGIAILILHELEAWARELGYTSCRLETGKRQPEAIAFYRKSGYHQIDNYLQYIGVENSICFEKSLIQIKK